MIRVIADDERPLYPGGMRVLAVRLLTLLAVLMMPFGMTAAATVPSAHHASAEMPMGHCPDRDSGHHAKGGIAECTMACSAALPALGPAEHEPQLITASPTVPGAVQRLHSLHPETATPPPKIS